MTLPNESTATKIELDEPAKVETLRLTVVSAHPSESRGARAVFVNDVRVRARPD